MPEVRPQMKINTPCKNCESLNTANVAKAFKARKPIVLPGITLSKKGWHEIVKDRWRAVFHCAPCKQWVTIILQLMNEPAPSTWWKS